MKYGDVRSTPGKANDPPANPISSIPFNQRQENKNPHGTEPDFGDTATSYEESTDIPYSHNIQIIQDISEPVPLTSISSDLLTGLKPGVALTKSEVSFEVASAKVLDTPQLSLKSDAATRMVGASLSYTDFDQSKVLSSAKFQHIRELRRDILSLRSRIHQIRASLRQKQQVKSCADDILVGRMRRVLSSHSDLPRQEQKSLEQLLQDCQEARDAYGPLEDECNQLEDHLSSQELKLSHLEELFYSQSDSTEHQIHRLRPEEFNANSKLASQPTRTMDQESLLEHVTDIQYHPVVAEYLSKLGDMDLLHERLEDLINEKESLEAGRQSRLRFGLTLDEDDQKWLDNSSQEYDTLVGSLKTLERECEVLKQECLSRGLVDEDGEPTTFQDQEEGYFNEEDEVHPGTQRSEYVKYPLLIPHPGIDQAELETYDPKPDQKSDQVTNRINEWLLKRLRMSVLDVNLLASTFENTIGKTNDEWQFSVLFFWYNDGISMDSRTFPARTGSLTTEGEDPVVEPPDPTTKGLASNRYYPSFGAPSPRSNNSRDTKNPRLPS